MRTIFLCAYNIEKRTRRHCTSLKARYRRYIHTYIYISTRPLRALLHAQKCSKKDIVLPSVALASPSSAPCELNVHIQMQFDEPAGKMMRAAAGERCRLDRGQGSSRSFDRAVDRIGPSLYIINIGPCPSFLRNAAPRRSAWRRDAGRARVARKARSKLNCAVEMGTAVGRSKAHFR